MAIVTADSGQAPMDILCNGLWLSGSLFLRHLLYYILLYLCPSIGEIVSICRLIDIWLSAYIIFILRQDFDYFFGFIFVSDRCTRPEIGRYVNINFMIS